jgi:transcription elongation factor GreB
MSDTSTSTIKNYLTPTGYARLRAEWQQLMDNERPKIVETIHWAAKNGDRSENGDYIYGKRRLREIDRRIQFLTKRLEIAEVVDASIHGLSEQTREQIFFGATVTYAEASGLERTVHIVGIDEADSLAGQVSWISPIAKALMRKKVGDVALLMTPTGEQEVDILDVIYPKAST